MHLFIAKEQPRKAAGRQPQIGESLFTLFASVISICLSLSDDANKIKTLNIEKAYQFQLSLKI